MFILIAPLFIPIYKADLDSVVLYIIASKPTPYAGFLRQ